MRGVAEDEDDRTVLVTGKFAEELQGLRTRKEEIGFANFFLRIFEGFGEEFGGLQSADVGAGKHQIGDGGDFSDTFCDLFCFLDALFGQEALGVGWTLGIFPVDGDTVSDDIELHGISLGERRRMQC